ncbi:MAG: cadherin-like domain-containing protein [Ardenticatenaceae bacterium]|nr:cadherin-like domain-containing protein [Ardenticatenaceae bacterium]
MKHRPKFLLFMAVLLPVLLLGVTAVILNGSPQLALAFNEADAGEAPTLSLAEITEITGLNASYQATSPDCAFDAAFNVYLCSETTPAARPQRNPQAAASARQLIQSGVGVLLVPDWTNDRVMAFDPQTGDLVDADFIPSDPTNLSSPKNAILSASGNSILVSDQIEDVVQEYDLDGNYLGVFAPSGGPNTAILDNILGIALRPNGNLLVTVTSGSNQDSVAEFDTAGNYLGNFIAIGSGGLDGPFDAYPRTADWLVPGINSDNLMRFDLAGAYIADLAAIDNFPQQVGEAANNNVLVANFGGTQEGVIEFSPTGSIIGVYDPAAVGGYRGVYELPNGNILTTNGSGVHEIDRNGNLIQTKISSVSAQYIELVQPGGAPNITFYKTVGTDPSTCAASNQIAVDPNTEVTYCYEVTNSGTVTFTLHDLSDSELGTIFTSLPYSLTPGASAFVTISTLITTETVNVGTWVAYNNGPTDVVTATSTATVTLLTTPAIEVAPSSLSSDQATNTQVTQTLTISNVGDADLDWEIFEEAAATFNSRVGADAVFLPGLVAGAAEAQERADTAVSVPTAPTTSGSAAILSAPTALLYDNGPLVNSPGTGVGGADEAVLQTTSLGLNTLGFGHQLALGYRIADDFTIPPGETWTLDTITFYAYQTGSTTTSTMNGITLQIWDGQPGAGGAVIWGDDTTNVLVNTGWANVYRVTETTTGTAIDRPIMASVAAVGGLSLPAGTYWLAWNTGGTLASGPWAPPININGQASTGNGLQTLDGGTTWAAALDTGAGTPQQGFPFLIEGSSGCAATDLPWVTASPLSGTIGAGNATDVAVMFDSTGYAAGVYTGTLCVNSNDPLSPQVRVPLTMTVLPNAVPVAADDAYTTTQDVVLTVSAPGVLANDTDGDGDSLTGVLNTDVTSGTLALHVDGSFTYTPTAGFEGTATFTYQANDGLDSSNVATVTITVVNTAPVAVADSYTTTEGITLTVSAPGVLDNDSDGDGDGLTAVLDTATSNGTLTLNTDGSFTYVPDAGFAGTDSFTYHANDGTDDSDTVTVTITVTGAQGFVIYLPFVTKN